MIIIIGTLVVVFCVFGGFVIGGGHLMVLIHPNELLIIGGGALGALLIMSPIKVLKEIVGGMTLCLKGAPHSRAAYEELLKVLYELFMLGRRGGMVALEEHIMTPENSAIFSKYPGFQKNKHAMEFLCNGLRPIIDGKIKPDHLKLLLDGFRLFSDADDRRLPSILAKSRDAQASVSSALADQVLGALHELLRGLDSADPELIREIAKSQPDHLYEGLLAILMRLVFILYAEDRDLLPLGIASFAHRIGQSTLHRSLTPAFGLLNSTSCSFWQDVHR
ncbi:MAG: motility-associated protein [Verrucomicrobiota bacterium]